MPQTDNSLTTTVYRKPTLTYLPCNGTITTTWLTSTNTALTNRTKTVCSSPQLFKSEGDHLKHDIQRCTYTIWALNRTNIKHNKPNRAAEGSINIRDNLSYNNNKKHHIMVPYTKRPSESCKKICDKHDIQMHFRGGRSIMDLLILPKNRDTIFQKGEVIYRYKCCSHDITSITCMAILNIITTFGFNICQTNN